MSDDNPTAIDILLAIRFDLEAADSPHATWFAERLDRWLAGEVDTLDRAFGVAAPGPGAWSARQSHFHCARDDALRRAYGFIDAPTQGAKVKELRLHVESMAAQWDNLSELEHPEPDWSGLKTALWWSFRFAERAGRAVPGEKRLCTIVADTESHNLAEVSGNAIESRRSVGET